MSECSVAFSASCIFSSFILGFYLCSLVYVVVFHMLSGYLVIPLQRRLLIFCYGVYRFEHSFIPFCCLFHFYYVVLISCDHHFHTLCLSYAIFNSLFLFISFLLYISLYTTICLYPITSLTSYTSLLFPSSIVVAHNC